MHVSPSGAAFNYGDAEEDTAGTMTPFPARPQLARCDNFDIILGHFGPFSLTHFSALCRPARAV